MENAEGFGLVKRTTILWLVFVLLAFGSGIGAGYLIWGMAPRQAAATQPTPAAQTTAQSTSTPVWAQGGNPTAAQRYNIPVGNLPAFGPADAPITIIEFSDFECPFCHKWFAETWSLLVKTYPGKLRLYYRDFPLISIHPNAVPAAIAARCANEQNQFWAFHDKVYSSTAYGNSTYEAYAAAVGIDVTKFKACVAAKTYEKDVNADLEFGSSLGIRGTPTFFINGIPLVGAQPFSAFQKIIDQELAVKK